MLNYKINLSFMLILVLTILARQSTGFAYEINEKFAINGVIAGAYQYQNIDGDDDFGRGTLPVQIELSFEPGQHHIFAAKFGFAAGNGLNDETVFVLAPWAADLEDDVQDINGTNRDYLLTAWYKHIFEFKGDNILGISAGIIDATDYLDENVYANDEYTQFMNEALVNGPNAFLPSYDTGAALQWQKGAFAASGVIMHVSENDYDNSYNFYGMQLGYSVQTTLGPGNYRVLLGATSKGFLDPTGTTEENHNCLLLSLDQKLGSRLGAWLRLGTQDDAVAVTYKNIYSGGLYISGSLWGREDDNGGLGYAYLDGGNTGLDNSQVLEAYARFVLNDYLAFTLDIQYMNDKYASMEKNKGFIYGIRATAEF
jgi:hypothetical protein